MIKHCKHCLTPFKAPPSGAKYCKYECYVYNQIKGLGQQQLMIDRYRATQIDMDKVLQRIHKGIYKREV